MKRKMCTASTIIVIIGIAVCLLCSSYSRPQIYIRDYTSIYEMQLADLLGGNYSIGDRRTISGIRNPEGKKYYYRYYEWEVRYIDDNGDTHNVTMNNREQFGQQALQWILDRVSEEYKQQYLVNLLLPKLIDAGIVADEDKCFCSCSQAYPMTIPEDGRSMLDARVKVLNDVFTMRYSQIESQPTAFCLASMEAERVFEAYPVYVFMSLDLSEDQINAAGVQIVELMNKTIDRIIEDTGFTCNLFIRVRDSNIVPVTKSVKYEWQVINGSVAEFTYSYNWEHELSDFLWDIPIP